ncbi:MAG: hypothetical protein R3D60_11010 [Paracoccaceae bacterium]
MNVERIDLLTEVVVQRLLVDKGSACPLAAELARDMARSAPAEPAITLLLPLTLAAAAIDEMLGAGTDARLAARDAWRAAALVGSEIAGLRESLGTEVRMADLWEHWALGDPIFRPGPVAH